MEIITMKSRVLFPEMENRAVQYAEHTAGYHSECSKYSHVTDSSENGFTK